MSYHGDPEPIQPPATRKNRLAEADRELLRRYGVQSTNADRHDVTQAMLLEVLDKLEGKD
jgi:hypothetical protein